MTTVTAVCKVRRAYIFAGRQQICDTHRQKRAQRYGKAFARGIEKRVRLRRDVQIDRVTAHANAVGKHRFCTLCDHVFRNGKLRFDTPRLSDVGHCRQTVGRFAFSAVQFQIPVTLSLIHIWPKGGLESN